MTPGWFFPGALGDCANGAGAVEPVADAAGGEACRQPVPYRAASTAHVRKRELGQDRNRWVIEVPKARAMVPDPARPDLCIV